MTVSRPLLALVDDESLLQALDVGIAMDRELALEERGDAEATVAAPAMRTDPSKRREG